MGKGQRRGPAEGRNGPGFPRAAAPDARRAQETHRGEVGMPTFAMRVFRGGPAGGDFKEYRVEGGEGMVVLDLIHQIQATQANDLACRWNCKAGKCGSCSAEINGKPRLMCMTRLSELPLEKPVTVEPMKAFPLLKDLVTDVSWNFRVKTKITKFKPRPPDAP